MKLARQEHNLNSTLYSSDLTQTQYDMILALQSTQI